MPRRRPPSAVAPAEHPLALPRPITVDPGKLEIPDISLMIKLQAAEGKSEDELQQLVFEIVPMLERLVVGGLSGFKLTDLPAVITEVFAQLKKAGDPGN